VLFAIIGAVFVTSFLVVFAVMSYVSSRRDPVRARLEQLAEDTGQSKDSYDMQGSLMRKGVNLLASNVHHFSSTRERLSRAGYMHPSAVYDYYLISLILLLVAALFTVIATLQMHLSPTQIVLWTIGGAAVGALIPRLFVASRIAKRREAIRNATPNMLDLLVVCVEAGLSFTAGIQRLSEEMKRGCPELSQELKIVTHEVLIGKPKADVLRALANRTEVEELRALAVTLIQTDRLGTSIGSSLRVLADSMRFKRRQRAEEAANKVSVKLVFPLVLLIFPELLIVLVGPAMINVFRTLTDVAK
jgi:tight adherence protein C